MSTTTILTLHYPAPSPRGSEQHRYDTGPDAALDRLVFDHRGFPDGAGWVSTGTSGAWILGPGGQFLGDVEIEVIS